MFINVRPFHMCAFHQERAEYYSKRIQALVDDILLETPEPEGNVYGVLVSMFMSPAYMQDLTALPPVESTETGKPG